MKQTNDKASMSANPTQEESVARSTVFDDVFRTIAQKMPQLLIPLINEVFHTNYSEDEDFEQLRNEHYEKYGKIITALSRNITRQSSVSRMDNRCITEYRSFTHNTIPLMTCSRKNFLFCYPIIS